MEAQHLCPGLRHHSWAVTGLLKAACLPSAQRQRARVSSLILQKAAQTVYPEPAPGLAPASLPSGYPPQCSEMLQLSHSRSAYSRDGPSSTQLAAAVALTGCRAQDTSVTQHEVTELGSLMSKRRIKVSTGSQRGGTGGNGWGCKPRPRRFSLQDHQSGRQADKQEQPQPPPAPPPAGRASAQQVDTKAGSREGWVQRPLR